ncbi:MAG: peptidase S9, partial [Tannerella sp.]|nr:peptidase S9 [Tannerella sp.]
MKKTVTAISMVAIMACNGTKRQDGGTSPEAAYIGQPDVKTENGQMTPEVLWAFGRVGSVCVAPDGRRVACTVTYYSIPENRSNSDIYVMDTDGRNGKQLTKTATRESSLAWLPSGRAIAFLRDGKLWNIDPDTGKETQVSELGEPVDGFVYAPAEDRILLVISTKLERYTGAEIYGDLDRANAYIYDDLMYRHWDSWKDGRYSHLYVGDIRSGRVTDVEDIMPDEPCDSPTKPFGGTEEIAWSPDGKTIVYTCKKLTGKAYAFQTNSDLYAYDVATKQTRLLTPGMPGYDRSPQFSPDGTKLLWLSMRRAGFEADRERIMLMDWPAAPASAGSATASAAAPASTGSASASAAAPASTGSASAPTAT